MDDFTALGIAEGWIPAVSDEEAVVAWQRIVDNRLGNAAIRREAQVFVNAGAVYDAPVSEQ